MRYVLQAQTDTLHGTIMLKHLIYMVDFWGFFLLFFHEVMFYVCCGLIQIFIIG